MKIAKLDANRAKTKFFIIILNFTKILSKIALANQQFKKIGTYNDRHSSAYTLKNRVEFKILKI